MTLLTRELRELVGRTVSYTAPEPLGRAAIRYYALAVGDDNPLYTDDEAARAAGLPGVIAPPTLVCDTNQYAGLAADADGHAGHSWPLEVSGATAVRGGNDYEFHRPVSPDDVITATWTLADISERRTRAGARMLVVVSEARYTNQRRELLAVNRETLLYVGEAR